MEIAAASAAASNAAAATAVAASTISNCFQHYIFSTLHLLNSGHVNYSRSCWLGSAAHWDGSQQQQQWQCGLICFDSRWSCSCCCGSSGSNSGKARPRGIGANRRDNRARRVSQIIANRRQSSRIVANRRESSRIVAFSFGQKWRFSFSLVRRPRVCPTCRVGAGRCDNTWSNTRAGMRVVA